MNMTIATALKGTILSAVLAVFSLSGAQAATKAPPKLAGDPVAGAAAFKIRCVVCHGIKADGGPIAPSLIGVFGRKAATTSFANYSDALKDKGLTWTAANLDEDFQMSVWGEDQEALARREKRYGDFRAAALLLDCIA